MVIVNENDNRNENTRENENENTQNENESLTKILLVPILSCFQFQVSARQRRKVTGNFVILVVVAKESSSL